MGDRFEAFLWILGSASFFGALGAAFGAISGAIAWRNGRTSGTGLGLRTAETFARISECELTPGRKGALVGAVDGFLFLATLGLLVGTVAAYQVRPPSRLLAPLAWGGLSLVGAALFFGLLASALVRNGVRALAFSSPGGILGAFAGRALDRELGLMIGAVLGVTAGTLVSFAILRESRRRRDRTERET